MRRAEIFASKRGTVEIDVEVRWARTKLGKEVPVNDSRRRRTVISVREQKGYVVVVLRQGSGGCETGAGSLGNEDALHQVRLTLFFQ
jgi:hypothetical protein